MSGAVLVTGAAGFIGSHVCEALVGAGRRVLGYDNFDPFYDRARKERNLLGLSGHGGFTLVEGDILDGGRLTAACREHGVTEVIHLAALAGVRPSIEAPLRYQQVNELGTGVVLEAARDLGVRNFLFGSSSSVYGDTAPVPFSEADPADHPISPYGATKRAGELVAHTYHHLFGLPVTCLRFFTVYGPRQRPDLAIAKFTRLIDAGAPVPFYGDGTTRRDYTYVDDIVAGVLAALGTPAPFATYNLGESATTSLADLVALIEGALEKRAVLDRQPFQPGDVKVTCADISRARDGLGYAPQTPIALGIPRYVAWYLGQKKEGAT